MDPFLQDLKSQHKVTYYVLPLLALNPESFSGFHQCYVNLEGTMLCVEVNSRVGGVNSVMDMVILNHRSLELIKGCQEPGNEGMVRFWFSIPEVWWPDVSLIIQGKYSRITETAKDMIRTYSGLMYQVQDPEGYEVFTDFRLLALDRAPSLRRKWHQLIRPQERIPETMDLMEPPGEQEFLEFQP